MAWTLHGLKEINKGPAGMGGQNKEKIASAFWSNKLPVFWHHVSKPFAKQ